MGSSAALLLLGDGDVIGDAYPEFKAECIGSDCCMGISINLMISKSVTCEEWREVYQETLRLVKKLSLAERREVQLHGIPMICLVHTEEHEEHYGWNKENVRTGWFADGDYESLHTSERYYLPRDLVTIDEFEADAPDAIYSMVPAILGGYDWNDERFSHYCSSA